MKADELIGVSLPWEQTVYEHLKDKAVVVKPWHDGKSYFVFFKTDLCWLRQIIAEPVCVGEAEIEDVETVRWKGESGYTLEFFPKIYRLIWWQKDEDGVPRREHHDVPVENVELLWGIMKNYKLGSFIKSKTICERIAEAQGLERFYRQASGTFDWEKFFGCRAEYLNRFNYPMKVLAELGYVEYKKCGFVARMKDLKVVVSDGELIKEVLAW